MKDPQMMAQSCWSFTPRELAEKLGLDPGADQWVVVEIVDDGGPTVDVMLRRYVSAAEL